MLKSPKSRFRALAPRHHRLNNVEFTQNAIRMFKPVCKHNLSIIVFPQKPRNFPKFEAHRENSILRWRQPLLSGLSFSRESENVFVWASARAICRWNWESHPLLGRAWTCIYFQRSNWMEKAFSSHHGPYFCIFVSSTSSFLSVKVTRPPFPLLIAGLIASSRFRISRLFIKQRSVSECHASFSLGDLSLGNPRRLVLSEIIQKQTQDV